MPFNPQSPSPTAIPNVGPPTQNFDDPQFPQGQSSGQPAEVYFDPNTGKFVVNWSGGGGGGGGTPVGGATPSSGGIGGIGSNPASGSPGSLFGSGGSAAADGAAGLGGAGAGVGAGAGGGAMATANSWLPWVNAVLGGWSSYEQAQAANKPKTTVTNSTQTQTPYGPTLTHLDRILEEAGKLYSAGPNTIGGRGGGGGGGGSVNAPGAGADARGIYNEVADRGLAAGDRPNVQLAERALADVWGGGETGFEGYNPILADLASSLSGSDLSLSRDLLQQYLGSGNSTGLAGGGSDRAAGGIGGGGGGGGGFNFSVGGGGMVPDTGAGSGTFQRELARIFSEEGNEAEIAAVIDSMRGDLERSKFSSMADLEARAQGTGRFGGDSHRADIATANARFAEELGQISAQLRYGDLTERRNARLAALNILNNRDVAAMSDATSRAGINASAGAAAASLGLQEKLGLRGQDLQAILGIMEGEKFNLGTLSGLGERLSGDRMGALSLIPGIEGVNLAGLDAASGAAGGLTNLHGIDTSARNAAADRGLRTQIFNANAEQQALDNYLRSVLGVASTGGTVTTQGTNVVPGAGYNTGAAAGMGALGGYLTGVGLQDLYGGRAA